MKRLFIPLLTIILVLPSTSAQNSFDYNCYTVIVGKNASLDGSVFIAHNEDNSGDPFIELHKVPRINHENLQSL